MSFAFDPAGLTLPNAHFIGGKYIPGPAAIDIRSPSTGAVLGPFPALMQPLSITRFRPRARRWPRRTGAGCRRATGCAPCVPGPI